MKKKVLAILMAAVMSLALAACGGEKETAEEALVEEMPIEEAAVEEEAEEAAVEVSGEYTEEQLAFVQEYVDMCDAYNATVDLVNATPELVEQEELIDVINQLTAAIDEADEICADPSLLTPEVMESLRAAFAETYKFIDEVNAFTGEAGTEEAVNMDVLLELFTIAYAGADEVENTYYFVCDEEVTFGGIVILSADMTQSVNYVGEITENEDGSLTINDESGHKFTFIAEQVEGGLILTLDDGTSVGVAPWDTKEVIDMIVAIDEGTKILSE